MESDIQEVIKDIRLVRLYRGDRPDPDYEGKMTINSLSNRVASFLKPSSLGETVYVKIYATGNVVHIYLGD